jgi:hypothetical protein
VITRCALKPIWHASLHSLKEYTQLAR